MNTLDKLKIKYFDDMVKLEQDKQRIIKMSEKKGMDISDFFGVPPKAKPVSKPAFNPYAKKQESSDDDVECYACRDTGVAYLSDGVFGGCLECGKDAGVSYCE